MPSSTTSGGSGSPPGTNPVWRTLQARPAVLMSVVDDYAYIPTTWRAKAGDPDEDGVPTSYYAAVQLTCEAEIIDEPEAKAELLRRQLAHFQPAGDHAQVAVDRPPYGRMLAGIRGLRLHVQTVTAEFKYDDYNPNNTEAPSPAASTTEQPDVTWARPRNCAAADNNSDSGSAPETAPREAEPNVSGTTCLTARGR